MLNTYRENIRFLLRRAVSVLNSECFIFIIIIGIVVAIFAVILTASYLFYATFVAFSNCFRLSIGMLFFFRLFTSVFIIGFS